MPTVTVYAVDELIREGESLSFEFRRTGDTAAALEVRYDITVEGDSNIFAEALPAVLTFTIPVGASSARIPGLLTNDNHGGGSDRVTAEVLASSGALPLPYDIGSPRTATVTVVDNTVTVHAVDEVIREGESLSFEFRRAGNTAAALEVQYDITVEGDSNVFAEALPAVLTFTIPVGASSARIPGLLTNDNNDVHESGGDRVTAEVLALSGALPLPYDIGSPRRATVTVVDNDDPAAGAGAPATGLQVTGDYQVGETLTANTGDIMDADGTTMADYTYEWERAAGTDDAAVQIGTASTYILAAADAGNFVRVTVRFTDDGFFPEVLSSPWREVAGPAPGPATGMPIIQGTTRVGETLTANTDDITDPDGLNGARAGDAGFAFTYQWQRANADGTGAVDIVGETNSTYVLTADDANRRLLVRVDFRDDGNNAETLTSLGSSVVDMLPTGLPTIDGAAAVGQTLTAVVTGIDDANGLSQAWAGDAGFAFTYQWRRANADGTGAVDIAGETNSTYVLAAADADRRVLVRVSFADDSSYDHTLDSESTGIVSAPATGLALTGTPEVGQTLMADVSGITDPNGVTTASYTYRWWRATAADGTGAFQIRPGPDEPPLTDRYTLADGDGGAWVRVSVTFTDDRGNEEILSSDWTEVPAPAEPMPLTVSIVTADSALASTEGAADNDLEFVVRLSAADERVITVPYALSGTATEDADYADAAAGSLTFAANVTEQTITLTVTDDDFDEANSETVIVALGTPTGATQGVTLGATATATATITDDDDPDIAVIRDGSATAREGGVLAWSFNNRSGASQTYRIELGSGATAADIAYVELDPDSDPATDNQRLSPVNGGYEITVPSTLARVTFGIAIDDDTAEGAEGLELVVFHGDGGTPADALFDAAGTETATITNVEQPTLLIASLAGPREDGVLSVEEGPAADPIEFEVNLSPQYAGPVTVTYTLSGTAVAGTDYNDVTDSTTDSSGTPVPGTLTFPGGDGTQATQTIRLALLDDATAEPEKTVIVTLDNMVRQEGQSSTAAAASTLTAETAVTDDDAISISVAAPVPQAPATEFVEGDDLVFTLTRTGGDMSLPLTVDYTVTATGAPACSPPPGPAMAGFAPNEATTEAIVAACADNVDEPDGEVTLTLTESANYDIDANAGAATVPVADGNVLEVSIRAPTARVAEGDAIEFAVILGDQTSRRDFDVFYTLEGDATPGADYPLPAGYDTTSNRGSFTIPADTESTDSSPGFFFSIVATDDGVAEVFETVILSIIGFSDDDIAAEVAGGAAATAIIAGDDGILSLSLSDMEIAENGGTATLTVGLGESTTFATDQTIILTLEGTADLGTDYTVTDDSDGSNIAVSGYQLLLPASASSASVTIIARDDAIDDDGETVELSAAHLQADPDNGGAAIGTATLTITEPPDTPAVGEVTIDGVPRVGVALTANTDAIDDPVDGLTAPNYRYGWERADDAAGTTGVANVGTNADVYTPAAADEGKFLRVTVTFTDNRGNEGTMTSDWTGAVAAVSTAPNTPATGDLTIDGVPRVGVALTANTDAIDDPVDGLTTPNYQYQWERADDAAGTTGVTNVGTNAAAYTPAVADEGRFLRVTATFTDDLGNGETRTSDWTGAVVAATTPSTPAVGDVTIDGVPRVGVALTANTDAIDDPADGLTTPNYRYQWERADDAAGTTGVTNVGTNADAYTPAAADEGRFLRVTVTFTDDLGNGETRTSDWTAAVAAASTAPDTPAVGDVTIDGVPRVGVALTANTDAIDDPVDGLTAPNYRYQWERAEDAAGTTGVTNVGTNADAYTPIAADEGRFLRVTVTFTDDLGNEETRTSDWTADAVVVHTPAVGNVTIDGVPRVGVALTANTDAIDDPVDGLTAPNYRYGWERADDAAGTTGVISVGTNADAYTPAAADEGRFLRVTATFTDDLGNEEARTSDWTGAVAAASTAPNTPAVGDVTIDGVPRVGVALTANTDAIDDPVDGLTAPNYRYQWERADDAAGTTGVTNVGTNADAYTPIAADEGRFLRVTATFTDDLGNGETRTSDWTAAVAAASTAPNTPAVGDVTIDGVPRVGVALTANTDAIDDPADGLTAPNYQYQWERADDSAGTAGVVNVGTNADAYTPAAADEDRFLRVTVTFTDDLGNRETRTSDWTGAVTTRADAAPTGEVTITPGGSLRVGQRLEATEDIDDANGLSGAAFGYQWSRVDADGVSNPEDIRGATDDAYVLTDADANKRVRVTVSYIDDDGYDGALTSDDTDVVDGPATGLRVTGDAAVGEILTADTDGVRDPNGTTRARNGDAGFAFTYQWQRVETDAAGVVSNPVDIAGANGGTYALVAADDGMQIRVRVRFADDDGNDEELFSDPTNPVNTPATGEVTIDGTAQVGETLTADTSAVRDDVNGLPTTPLFTYQWQRANDDQGAGAANIAGATGSSYTAVEADQDNWVRVVVRFQDADGNDETLESDWEEVIPEENTPASGGPTIRGRAVVGALLTASPDGITDVNGVPAAPAAFLWQWQRVDEDGVSNLADILGATQATYRLTAEDEGRRIRVRAVFIDNDGVPETVTSDPTAVVEIDATLDEAAVSKSLALFGRAVTMQVLDATRLRLDGRCAAESQLTVAGQSVGWDSDKAEESAWRTLRRLSEFDGISGQNALAGSSFSFGRQASENSCVSFWGRGSYSSYTDKEDGLTADGSAATGQLGADWSSGPWMLGLSVAHSMGGNDYDHQEFAEELGEVDIDLTGIYPYARYRFTERFSTWAAGGVGMGDLKFKPQGGETIKTDLDLLMGAGGLRGELLSKTEGGFSMAMKADAFYVQMESDEAAEQLDAVSTDTRRLRLGLEGAHTTELQGGATVTPTLELGLLHDRGGVSTGSGLDVGLAVTYEDAAAGFWVDLKGRSLVAHEAGSLKEWGVSGELRYDLDLSSERGFALSLNSGYGARAAGGAEALFNLRDFDSLEANRKLPGGRLDAEIGYGLGAFGDRFVSKPWAGLGMTETGSEWRLGWQLAPVAAHNPLQLRLGVELNHRAGNQALMLNVGAGL